MDRCVGAAARLPGGDLKDLAIQALARSEAVSDLAARHGVSRKFVYQQTHKAGAALDGAFSPAVPDSEVLFELAVTKAWLRTAIVRLTLICRSSYRGVVECFSPSGLDPGRLAASRTGWGGRPIPAKTYVRILHAMSWVGLAVAAQRCGCQVAVHQAGK